MIAAIRRKYGTPQDISIEELPIPHPGPNEILIRVLATTVNRTDVGVLTGLPFIFRFFAGFPKPRHLSPGTDFAGVVEKVGAQVIKYKEGDRVLGFHDHGSGSQAEYMTYDVKLPMAKIPDGLDFHTAVASLEGAHYAINFINKVELNKGQKVMLNGATGAIGSAALQILKAKGLVVTAICGTGYLDKIKELGADKVYDYQTEDFTRDEDIYDFVFDAVGKSSFGKCKRLLKPDGAYISSELGPRNENPFLAIWTAIRGGKKVIFPFPDNVQGSIDQMVELLNAKKYHPLIDKVYPLEEISNAYEYVASGQKIGNVILDLTADRVASKA